VKRKNCIICGVLLLIIWNFSSQMSSFIRILLFIGSLNLSTPLTSSAVDYEQYTQHTHQNETSMEKILLSYFRRHIFFRKGKTQKWSMVKFNRISMILNHVISIPHHKSADKFQIFTFRRICNVVGVLLV